MGYAFLQRVLVDSEIDFWISIDMLGAMNQTMFQEMHRMINEDRRLRGIEPLNEFTLRRTIKELSSFMEGVPEE